MLRISSDPPSNQPTNQQAMSIDALCMQAAKLLGPPTTFNAAKLKVEFAGEELLRGKKQAFPRAYTLTHCDLTANLTLAVTGPMTSEQLRSWQSTLQRDDVVAEWKEAAAGAGEMTLHVHCFVSGANLLQELAAGFRYYVFSKELPLVRLISFLFNSFQLPIVIDGWIRSSRLWFTATRRSSRSGRS